MNDESEYESAEDALRDILGHIRKHPAWVAKVKKEHGSFVGLARNQPDLFDGTGELAEALDYYAAQLCEIDPEWSSLAGC